MSSFFPTYEAALLGSIERPSTSLNLPSSGPHSDYSFPSTICPKSPALFDSGQTRSAPMARNTNGEVAPRKRRRVDQKRLAHANTPAPCAVSWEDLRPTIEENYVDRNESLENTIKEIEEKFDFRASVRSYKTKLKSWGLEKNIKATEMCMMVAIADKRQFEEGKKTVFRVGPRTIGWQELQRFGKRKIQEGPDFPARYPVLPPNIRCETPFGETPANPERTGTPTPEENLVETSMISSNESSSCPQQVDDSDTLLSPRRSPMKDTWANLSSPEPEYCLLLEGENEQNCEDMIDTAGELYESGQVEKAIALYRQAFYNYGLLLGFGSKEALEALYDLGIMHIECGYWEQALLEFKRSWVGFQQLLGRKHHKTTECLKEFTSLSLRLEYFDGKPRCDFLEQTIAEFEYAFGLDSSSSDSSKYIRGLAKGHSGSDDLDEILLLYNRALIGFERLQYNHKAFEASNSLIEVFQRNHRSHEAKTELTHTIADVIVTRKQDNSFLAWPCLRELVTLALRQFPHQEQTGRISSLLNNFNEVLSPEEKLFLIWKLQDESRFDLAELILIKAVIEFDRNPEREPFCWQNIVRQSEQKEHMKMLKPVLNKSPAFSCFARLVRECAITDA